MFRQNNVGVWLSSSGPPPDPIPAPSPPGKVLKCGPQAGGQQQARVAPPALNVFMVARGEHRRHRLRAPDFGSGVVRTIEQTVQCGVETVLDMALGVPQHLGLHTGDGVQKNHGRQFAARQHKVPQADLLVYVGIDESLVQALVATTDQNRPLAISPLLHQGVVEHTAYRRKKQHFGGFFALRLGLLHGKRQGLGHHHHARTTAKRAVVHAAVGPLRMVARVVGVDLHLPRFKSAPGDARL
jgi:hypothetical protein